MNEESVSKHLREATEGGGVDKVVLSDDIYSSLNRPFNSSLFVHFHRLSQCEKCVRKRTEGIYYFL